jgi:HEPN domain-containing protein
LEVPSERINKAQAERALEVAEAVVSIANKALGVA